MPTRPPSSSSPSISAVIPAYNAAETIERALQSVYAQTYPDVIEVIVVDDGSSDDTAQIVAKSFPQATLITQENAGNAAARNRGVREARGECLAFLDADDEWAPDHLSVIVAARSGFARAELLQCQEVCQPVTGSLRVPSLHEGLHSLGFREWLLNLPGELGFTSCCSGWLISREAFEAVGGFDEAFRQCVDVEFVLRFTSLGYTLIGVAHPGYQRFIQKESVSVGGVPSVCGPKLYCALVRSYAPDPSRPGGALLTRLEYEGFLKRALALHARALVSTGRAPEARELFREARGLRGGSFQIRMSIMMGTSMPGVVNWLFKHVWVHFRRMQTAIRVARRFGKGPR